MGVTLKENVFMWNEEIWRVNKSVESRWATAENPTGEKGAGGMKGEGRKGSPSFSLESGETKVLAFAEGVSGVIRRIWVTIPQRNLQFLRGLRIRMYWDGSKKPAVDCPLGDFFGMSLGHCVSFQSALFSSPEGRSFNCYIPMPFRKGMKIEVLNETTERVDMFFYEIDYTLNDVFDSDIYYFHAFFRRQKKTILRQDYEFLPYIKGNGRYLGVNFGVQANMERYGSSWWGEGEVKIFLDGDRVYPTLCGTGTEDYIGTGWGQGSFNHQYQGCHLADHEKLRYCFYRYHIPDPVFFRKDIRATIQQIGCYVGEEQKESVKEREKLIYAGPGIVHVDPDAPGALFEREDDWSSCAYLYLDQAENTFPDILPFSDRI